MSDKACLTRAELELTQKIQMHFPSGVISPELLREWNGCSKEILAAKLTGFFSKSPEKIDASQFLKLISGEAKLMLDALDGKEILAEASEIFAYIDSDFKNWSADEQGGATEEMAVDVYELVKDGTFAQFFGSVCNDVSKLCLTQAQIKNFVVNHRNWLRTDGYATLFLFKSHDNFVVAGVSFGDGGALRVSVHRFEIACVWYAENRRRVVLPQLA